jgi:hypothetical protein
VVVQGKYIIADWFSPEMDPDLHIETSEKGFTTDEIAVKWLHHFIKHSDAGPNAEEKLLLMDNHGSHKTGEFVQLANLNHILPYPFWHMLATICNPAM